MSSKENKVSFRVEWYFDPDSDEAIAVEYINSLGMSKRIRVMDILQAAFYPEAVYSLGRIDEATKRKLFRLILQLENQVSYLKALVAGDGRFSTEQQKDSGKASDASLIERGNVASSMAHKVELNPDSSSVESDPRNFGTSMGSPSIPNQQGLSESVVQKVFDGASILDEQDEEDDWDDDEDEYDNLPNPYDDGI